MPVIKLEELSLLNITDLSFFVKLGPGLNVTKAIIALSIFVICLFFRGLKRTYLTFISKMVVCTCRLCILYLNIERVRLAIFVE